MANSDKNIVIRPSIGSTIDQPSITFTGAGNTSITLKILDDSDGTLSFEGYQGQVFAINNNLASGIIYSVNDISGLPVIDANADGTIRLGIYTGNIGVGTTSPTSKLHVVGNSLLGNFRITQVGTGATVGGIGVTYFGDGSNLTGVSGGFSISTNTTNQTQYLTYAVSTGTTTGLGVNLSSLVFNPSTTRLGIGTANPLGSLQVGAGTSTVIINQVGAAVSVGIGTTNPQYIFTVTDTGTPATTGLTNCLADFTTTANSYGQINLRNTSTGTNASADIIITADNGTDSTNFIDLGINNSGFSVGSWTINGANDGYLYTSDGNLSIGAINASVAKYISFFTGGTLISNERMRINSTGVGIGTTNPQATLQVGTGITMYGVTGIISAVSYRGDGSQLTGVSGGLTVADDTSTNATRYILFDDSTSGTVTTINVSSTKLTFNPSTGNLVAGGTVTANSDQKLKTDVQTIENALEKVLSLRGVEFTRIDNGDKQIGVIAQEVEEIIPEVVYPKQSVQNDETKSVAYGNIVGLLIEAIKEQNKEIQELKRRLEEG